MENIIEMIKKRRNNLLIIIDIIIIMVSYVISYFLFLDKFSIYNVLSDIEFILSSIIIFQVLLNVFGLYRNMVRYETGKDYLIYILMSFISYIFVCIAMVIFRKYNIVTYIKIATIAYIILTVGIISYRLIIRIIFSSSEENNKITVNNNKRRLLLIGGGASTRDIIKIIRRTSMNNEYEIVGIIDDDKSKINYTIAGVKILGDRNSIKQICESKNINIIFFTITKIDSKDKKEILDICQSTKIKIRILPSTETVIKNKNLLQSLRDVKIEDLLCREPIELDNSNIEKLINNNVVLVTGGGGSIGSELCRQIIKCNPEKLIMVDIYENNLYDIEMELKSKYDENKIEAIIGSIRDKKSLEYIFDEYNPNIVFHAAAHKHVPLMETSPIEAIKNNVFGTYNVVNICDKYEVEKCVLISSDKAVNPTNVMGATKRFCEMIVQAKNKVSSTEYVAVRFGNVLGSNGSVIPLFKKQIANGGPITVTHKDITRFFMTIPEAVGLVLQASTYAKGGEIFVLDMGEPVKIYDLAESVIKLSGFEPHVDIPIKVVGLRPGEKLYEELLMSDETLTSTDNNKIFIEQCMNISMDDIEMHLSKFSEVIDYEKFDRDKLIEVLSEIVPTYVNKKVGEKI